MSPELIEVLKASPVAFVLAYGWIMEKRRADKERSLNEVLARELAESSVRLENLATSVIAIAGGRKADA